MSSQTVTENPISDITIQHDLSLEIAGSPPSDVFEPSSPQNNVDNQNYIPLPSPDNVVAPPSIPQVISNTDLIAAFSLRHQLSDVGVSDLISMLHLMGVDDVPRNASFLSLDSSSKTFHFCRCNFFKETSFQCQSCQQKSENFYHIPNFEANCMRIVSRNFYSGASLDVTIYTDGISTFKTSKYSIWPVYMVFNNMPMDQRFNLSNVLICGIWYGKSKPDMQILLKLFLHPRLEKFNDIFTINSFTFRLSIKFIVADKPARAMLLNFQSSNAKYFCPCCTCISTNETISGKRHIFFRLSQVESLEARTKEWFSACAYSAESTGIPEYGIKGPCFLQNIRDFEVIDSNIFDYMHSVCLGIFKSLINLLFFDHNSRHFLRTKISSFDRISKQIKFPFSIVKCPPIISNHNLWQAKDYRNFFLFSFPILTWEYQERFVECIMLLRAGLLLILQYPSEQDCLNSKALFTRFLNEFKDIFGEHRLTPNFHDLHHLPQMALRYGSLIEYTGFNFEHINGRLARLCHGNKRFDMQISRKLDSIVDISDYLDEPFSPRRSFLNGLFAKKQWKITHRINDQIGAVGKLNKIGNISEFSGSLLDSGSAIYFEASRALLCQRKISTKAYSSNKVFSGSSYVKRDHSDFIEIQSIIIEKSPVSSRCLLLVKKSNIIETGCHLFSINGDSISAVVDAESLMTIYNPAIIFNSIIVPVIKLECF